MSTVLGNSKLISDIRNASFFAPGLADSVVITFSNEVQPPPYTEPFGGGGVGFRSLDIPPVVVSLGGASYTFTTLVYIWGIVAQGFDSLNNKNYIATPFTAATNCQIFTVDGLPITIGGAPPPLYTSGGIIAQPVPTTGPYATNMGGF